MQKKIYVITAVHNRYEITEKFIGNLLKQSYPNIHLVLVDDGSTDGTAEMVKSHILNATILKGEGDLWWGGALQKAFDWICKNAQLDEFIFISNDDVEIDSDYINLGISKLNNRNNVLISGLGMNSITNDIIDAPIKWDFKKFTGKPMLYDFKAANCVSTRSLFMTVNTMKSVGGFHPILLPHYASDYEWTIRAVKKGCKIEAYKELNYKFDDKNTGIRNREKVKLKQVFSKKANFNPIYRFSFIVLSTPFYYLPNAFWNQIKRILIKEDVKI